MSSGLDIDADKFEEFCLDTAKLYVQKYNWYYMPQSLHRLLIHGASVIRNFNLPIGILSEEAQEAKNKEFKKFRESFTRKISRIKTNEDLMRRLLCSSDPLINSLRKIDRPTKTELPEESKNLIIESESERF